MDYGISEFDFWNMTLAEIERAIKAAQRKQKREAQEKASFDYILADLIGRSVARIHSSSNQLPKIYDAYPNIFDKEAMEEEIQKKKDELSMMRLKQFMNFHNKKFEEVGEKND